MKVLNASHWFVILINRHLSTNCDNISGEYRKNNFNGSSRPNNDTDYGGYDANDYNQDDDDKDEDDDD